MKRFIWVLVGLFFLGSIPMVMADEVVVVKHDDTHPIHKIIKKKRKRRHHKVVKVIHHDVVVHHDDVHHDDAH